MGEIFHKRLWIRLFFYQILSPTLSSYELICSRLDSLILGIVLGRVDINDVEIDSCIYQHICITSQCHPKQICQILGQSSKDMIFSAQEQYKVNYKKSLPLEFYHLLDLIHDAPRHFIVFCFRYLDMALTVLNLILIILYSVRSYYA